MLIMSLVFIFILGTIIGSFLNVVILRYNTGRSINGRSGCMHCDYQLRWYDLIPLFSWVLLRGRCRQCQSKISVQYPAVELATGLIFLAIFWHLIQSINFTEQFLSLGLVFAWHALIFSILIVIFVYDLRHKIIPNELSYSFAGLALIQTIFLIINSSGPFSISTFSISTFFETINILNLLSGPILFFFFWSLWFISKGRWIGLGDGKLALGIGWYLGFIYGLSAIILGFWIGAIFSLVLLLIVRLNRVSKNITMKTEIPFAPFLIIGLVIEFFCRIDFLGLSAYF